MDLLAADAKRLPRGESEALAESLEALARKRAPQVKGFDAGETLNELRACEFLEALVSDAARLVAMSQEMQRRHESNVQKQMLVLHQHAEAAAQPDPNIDRAIAAFEDLTKQRRAKRGKLLTVVA
jgi:hypothetical protein